MSGKDRFASKMMSEIRRLAPEAELRYDAAEFRIDVGETGFLNLDNAFDEYRRAGLFRRGEVVRRFAQGCVVPAVPTELAKARDAIVPKVRERIFYETMALSMELEERGALIPEHRKLTEHLEVELVWDLPDHMALLGGQHLEAWGRSFEDLLDVAGER